MWKAYLIIATTGSGVLFPTGKYLFPERMRKWLLWARFIQRIIKINYHILCDENTRSQIPNAPSHATDTEICHLNKRICQTCEFFPQYWFTLFCREAIFVKNLRTFWGTFNRSKNAVVNQKCQISGVVERLQLCEWWLNAFWPFRYQD